ncbi:hypothetical protein HDU99_002820, partial [Rhizoclosmatium hyalinum]
MAQETSFQLSWLKSPFEFLRQHMQKSHRVTVIVLNDISVILLFDVSQSETYMSLDGLPTPESTLQLNHMRKPL